MLAVQAVAETGADGDSLYSLVERKRKLQSIIVDQ